MDEDKKRQKKNIYLMLAVALVLIVGILTRWSDTKGAIVESIKTYFE
ncbi:MAG: hypothetical protein R3Y04_09695 [Rikenellaceae bacterium]